MTESNYLPPVSRLLTLGEGERRRQWPDYLVLGLTLEHVPDLIRMALDDELHSAAPDSLDVWAPLHAWRALGQLQAEDAAEPLIQLLVRIDDFGDDWVNQELPQVLGMIGPSVVPLLADYLADPSTKLWASVSTTTAFEKVGNLHPQARDDCVAILTGQLERFSELDPILNSFLISSLIDLRAVETAPVIERAFAADRVDIPIQGDWEDVQIELGLLDVRRTPKPNYHQAFWEALRSEPAPPPEEKTKKRRRKRRHKRK